MGRRLTHEKALRSTKKTCGIALLDDGITDSTRVRCRVGVIRRGCLQHRVVLKLGGLLTYSLSRAVSVTSALMSTRDLLSHLRKRFKRGSAVHNVSTLVASAVGRTRTHVTGDIGKIANVPAKLASLSHVASK